MYQVCVLSKYCVYQAVLCPVTTAKSEPVLGYIRWPVSLSSCWPAAKLRLKPPDVLKVQITQQVQQNCDPSPNRTNRTVTRLLQVLTGSVCRTQPVRAEVKVNQVWIRTFTWIPQTLLSQQVCHSQQRRRRRWWWRLMKPFTSVDFGFMFSKPKFIFIRRFRLL